MKSRFTFLILFLFVFQFSVLSVYGQSGSIDQTYNPLDSGFNKGTGPGVMGNVQAMARQSDGKLILAGDFVQYEGVTVNGLCRINADGKFDKTFKTSANFSGVLIKAITTQPDGKILIVGYWNNGTRQVARLNTDGSFDVSFNAAVSDRSMVTRIALQPDGKIIITGSFSTVSGTARNRIARLNTDGSLDKTFDPGTGLTGSVNKILVDPAGKILIGGNFSGYNGAPIKNLARLNIDGSIDASFSTASVIDGPVSSMCLQSDGKIFIVGQFLHYGSMARRYIAKINNDGTLEPSFQSAVNLTRAPDDILPHAEGFLLYTAGGEGVGAGLLVSLNWTYMIKLTSSGMLDNLFNVANTDGNIYAALVQPDLSVICADAFRIVTANDIIFTGVIRRLNVNGIVDLNFAFASGVNKTITASAIQVDGKVIVGGDFTFVNKKSAAKIARVNADGSIDADFTGSANGSVNSISLAQDGKILIGGEFTVYGGRGCEHIARLNSNGTLDASFTSPFQRATNTTVSLSGVYNIKSLPSGKVLVAGQLNIVNGAKGVVRLNNDGSLDASFNSLSPSITGVVTALCLQTDGKIVIAGQFKTTTGPARTNIARLNADGSVDNTFSASFASSFIRSVIVQADGKILAGGLFAAKTGAYYNQLILRINSDGTMDEAFNANNASVTGSQCENIILQSDGKILVMGYIWRGIVRLNPDGTRDVVFNAGLGVNQSASILAGGVKTAVIQANGQIIAGGEFVSYNGTGRNRLVRINN